MNKKKKLKIFKLVLFVIAVIILTVITIYLFPVMRNLSTKEGQIAFKDKVTNSGIYGVLLLFIIQLAQIFLFILPTTIGIIDSLPAFSISVNSLIFI